MHDLDPTPHPHAAGANYTDGIRSGATIPPASDTVLPHDLDAERSVIAASIRSRHDHERLAVLVDASDFWFPEHQLLFEACFQIADIGPFVATTHDDVDWAELSPITFPSSRGVRVGALAVLVDHVPVWALDRIAGYGNGDHWRHAATVKRKAQERDEVINLSARISDLTGGRR